MLDVQRDDFRSMGTDVSLIGPTGTPDFGIASAAVRAVFDREDRRFSRFRADSELAHVNAHAGSWTSVSLEFAAVVGLALAGWEETEGRFDPTVLDAVIVAGYDRDFDELLNGARGALRPSLPCGRAGDVELVGGRIRLPHRVGLDLGGLAKGWTADVAAAAAVACGLPWALVNAGGDLRLAGEVPSSGIDVGVTDPDILEVELASVVIDHGALATSSVTRRAWGPGLHHLIDPATARPAEGSILQATVWAATCAEAEVRAKDALLVGETYLDRGAALLVHRDGRVSTNLAGAEVVPA
jgi:thiamine biosynthesis lipoprotein